MRLLLIVSDGASAGLDRVKAFEGLWVVREGDT